MKTWALFLGIFLTPVTSQAQTKCIGQSAPIHEKLASIDVGHSCPEIVLINRFRTLLDRITPRCEGETRVGVADALVKARSVLYKEGVEKALLEITEYLARVTRNLTSTDCVRLLVIYILANSDG